jgi:hypothetical protein
MSTTKGWIVQIGLFLLATTAAFVQSVDSTAAPVVPRLVKFSGALRDEAGLPKSGIAGVTFALYKEQSGGAPLWLETQNVTGDSKGNYTILLGSTKPEGLPADLFASNEAQWLGVQVEGQAEQRRILFVSVPYALKAADAETIGGLPPSAFVRAAEAGTTRFSGTGQQSSLATSGTRSSATPPASTLNVITASPGDTPGFLPFWTGANPSHTVESSVLFQNGSKLLGINTKTPGASLEIDSTNQLGLFLHAPFSGNVGTGLDLATTGSGGRQWEILATGSTAAQGSGKLNIRDINSGKDIFTISSLDDTVGVGTTNPGGAALTAVSKNANDAVLGQNITNDGNGVEGETSGTIDFNSGVVGVASATSGVTYGVNGVNNATNFFAAGVEGDSFATSGPTLGTVGTTASPTGTGVWGFGFAPSNTGKGIGCCPVGVWGDTGSNGGGAAGLVGTADDGQGLYLENNSPSGHPTAFMKQDASGKFALFAGGGNNLNSCTIDTNGALFCPGGTSAVALVDSGQRQVALYGVQSPQSWFEDFGSGSLQSGATAVTLDRTFAQTVNASSEYHVFLTPEGDCRGLYVSKKTAGGFEVRELGGGQSNVAFGYRIVALRRGFESVRLEDMTERLARASARQPKAPLHPGLTMPRRRALNVPDASGVATSAKLRALER